MSLSLLTASMFGSAIANEQAFLENLKTTGRDIEELTSKSTISRYEITRLLNAVNCNDCTNPSQSTRESFDSNRWNTFQGEPGNNFWDIQEPYTTYENDNYYYCVAHVGDEWYMNWYPMQTSPICWWNFCWINNTTNAEFIQILINIAAPLVASDISTNRATIQEWTKSLSATELQEKWWNQGDQTVINLGELKCGNQSCKLSQRDEVSTYLKYCRFNLDACAMRPYPWLQQWAWPVSELNLLEKTNILTQEQEYLQWNLSIHNLVAPFTAIQAFANIFDIVQCTPDHDYDCDTVDNARDNCPYTYNPSQDNYDNDTYGDVCDNDTDNDGIQNPIWIIDESGNIVIEVITGDRDQCLFDRTNTTCSNIAELGLSIDVTDLNITDGTQRYSINVSSQSNSDTSQVEWITSDGYSYKGSTIEHTFTKAWMHYIQAQIIKWDRSAQAAASVYIPTANALDNFFASVDSYDDKQVSLDIPTVPSSDSVEILLNGKKNQEKKIIVDSQSTNIISVLHKDTEWQTISINEISHYKNQWNAFLFLLKNNSSSIDVNSTLLVESNLNISADQILSHQWYVNQNKVQSDRTSLSYTIPEAGVFVIQQRIILLDGNTLQATLTVRARDLQHSQAFSYSLVPDEIIFNNTGASNINISNTATLVPSTHIRKNEAVTEVEFDLIPPATIWVMRPLRQGGQNTLSYDIFDQHCLSLHSKATVIKNRSKTCLQHFNNPLSSNLICDQDQDTIPDICDNDIDGDWVPNLIWLITHEKSDCSIDKSNINRNWVQQKSQNPDRIWFDNLSCQLDNCPFNQNSEQKDQNNDGQGDICQWLAQLLNTWKSYRYSQWVYTGWSQTWFIRNKTDKDNDGISDQDDACPSLGENYNGHFDKDGCPEINPDLWCTSTPIPIALPAPTPREDDYCKEPYPIECVCEGLTQKQCCQQHNQDCPDTGDDDGEDDNECKEDPYGLECKCFGLTQQQCCEQQWLDCKDYCKEPYPEECKCEWLTTEQCCIQYWLDCPDTGDDDGEDDNECKDDPYGLECKCFGLTEQQCCQEQWLDCSDYCKEPYPDDCICEDLTQEQCCEQHGLDCPDTGDDDGEDENECKDEPYGLECMCFGLTQEQCCDQYGLDCDEDHCKEPYPDECKCKWLTAQQCCEQHGLDCPDDEDDPEEDDDKCTEEPYGIECMCFGLTQEQCCQQHGLDCDDDHCKEPYPDECKCKWLTAQQCCEQHGLDCPDDEDDPEEDDDKCTEEPYGIECMCFGLTQEQCCQQHGLDCDDDHCKEPYPDECLCKDLTQEQCCEQYGLDCPDDEDDPDEDDDECTEQPYGAECMCYGLTQEQCCEIHNLDCPDDNECNNPPYWPECICHELTQEQCCFQHQLDCEDWPPIILPPDDEDGPVIDVIDCNICPCQFVDFESDLNKETLIKTRLYDITKKRVFDDSLPHVIQR